MVNADACTASTAAAITLYSMLRKIQKALCVDPGDTQSHFALSLTLLPFVFCWLWLRVGRRWDFPNQSRSSNLAKKITATGRTSGCAVGRQALKILFLSGEISHFRGAEVQDHAHSTAIE
jgi:hypothetical protein